MTAETAIAIGSSIGFLACGAAACYERFRSRKRDDIAALANSLVADRDAWKSLHEAKASELATYRETAHHVQNEANLTILRLTEENAKLKGATDLTPLLTHQAEQTEINRKILSSLDMVLERLRSLQPCESKRKPNPKGKTKP